MRFIEIWLITFVALLFGDYILHTFVLHSLFESQLGDLVRSSSEAKILPIVLVEIIVSFAITYFTLKLSYKSNDMKNIIKLGTLFGLLITGMYHLVNLSTLIHWSVLVSVIDTLVAGILQYIWIVWLVTVLNEKIK
jgi:uncharacterized membrane protein